MDQIYPGWHPLQDTWAGWPSPGPGTRRTRWWRLWTFRGPASPIWPTLENDDRSCMCSTPWVRSAAPRPDYHQVARHRGWKLASESLQCRALRGFFGARSLWDSGSMSPTRHCSTEPSLSLSLFESCESRSTVSASSRQIFSLQRGRMCAWLAEREIWAQSLASQAVASRRACPHWFQTSWWCRWCAHHSHNNERSTQPAQVISPPPCTSQRSTLGFALFSPQVCCKFYQSISARG